MSLEEFTKPPAIVTQTKYWAMLERAISLSNLVEPPRAILPEYYDIYSARTASFVINCQFFNFNKHLINKTQYWQRWLRAELQRSKRRRWFECCRPPDWCSTLANCCCSLYRIKSSAELFSTVETLCPTISAIFLTLDAQIPMGGSQLADDVSPTSSRVKSGKVSPEVWLSTLGKRPTQNKEWC